MIEHCPGCGQGAWGLYATPELEADLEEGEPYGICLGCVSTIFIDGSGNVMSTPVSVTDVLVNSGIGKGK